MRLRYSVLEQCLEQYQLFYDIIPHNIKIDTCKKVAASDVGIIKELLTSSNPEDIRFAAEKAERRRAASYRGIPGCGRNRLRVRSGNGADLREILHRTRLPGCRPGRFQREKSVKPAVKKDLRGTRCRNCTCCFNRLKSNKQSHYIKFKFKMLENLIIRHNRYTYTIHYFVFPSIKHCINCSQTSQ